MKISSLIVLSILAVAAFRASADSNLVVNGDFDTDVSSWLTSQNFSLVWNAEGMTQGSGSGRLTSSQMDAGGTNNGGGGARQCVPVAGGRHDVSAFYLIPSAQNRTAEPDVALAWFANANCQGTGVGSSLIPKGASTTDSWLQLQGRVVAPGATQSANVILRPRKLEAGGSVDVLFDAVFLPEPGSAAAGLVAVAAIATRRRLLSRSTS